MLDVFVREAFAVGALGEAYAFAQGAVVGFGVRGVEDGDGVAAGYAYWHCCGLHCGERRVGESRCGVAVVRKLVRRTWCNVWSFTSVIRLAWG
jgi:hypothetical protein